MELSEVTRKNAKAVKAIYHAAFPKEERMPFWTMRLLAKMPTTQLLAFYEGGTLCGFAYVGLGEKVAFLMFLAVDQASRSQGHGSAILQALRERYPYTSTWCPSSCAGRASPTGNSACAARPFTCATAIKKRGGKSPSPSSPRRCWWQTGISPPKSCGTFSKPTATTP